jgi:predicted membrane protein
MNFSPSHFTAVLLFALCTGVVFGITMRDTPKRMVRYGAGTFGVLVGAAVVLSWLMFFLAR